MPPPSHSSIITPTSDAVIPVRSGGIARCMIFARVRPAPVCPPGTRQATFRTQTLLKRGEELVILTEDEAMKILSVAFGKDAEKCGMLSRNYRVPAKIASMLVPEVKAELTKRALSTQGQKAALHLRLRDAMITEFGG